MKNKLLIIIINISLNLLFADKYIKSVDFEGNYYIQNKFLLKIIESKPNILLYNKKYISNTLYNDKKK